MRNAHSGPTALLAACALQLGACHPREDAPPSSASSSSAQPASRVGSPSVPPAASSSPPASPVAACAALFAPPAGADLLCDEHVMGSGMEIHWRSFGLTEPREAVGERYRALLSSCPGAGLAEKPPRFDVALGDRRLGAFEASDGAYPKCTISPRPAHKTVIVISEKYAHP